MRKYLQGHVVFVEERYWFRKWPRVAASIRGVEYQSKTWVVVPSEELS